MRTTALIVKKSLARHKLSTSVTAGSLALACGLVIGVFSIQEQSLQAFATGAPGFDAVLGARGSQLRVHPIQVDRCWTSWDDEQRDADVQHV